MKSIWLAAVVAFGVAGLAPAATAADVRMFVHHEVTDYAAWRKVYDDFGSTRKHMGVKAQAVYRSLDNPNDVMITHDFKDVASARAFANSAELKAAMQKAGVKGAPTIWYTEKAAR